MPRLPGLLLAVCGAGLLTTPPAAPAQPPEGRPFDSTLIEVIALSPLDSGALDEGWSPNAGLELNLEMPFYWGRAQAGFQTQQTDGTASYAPDFDSVFLYAGWGAETRMVGPVLGLGAVRTGILWMQFDDDGNQAGGADESELAFEFLGRARLPFAGKYHAAAAAQYRLALTRPEMEQFSLSFGLGMTFTNPDWIRRFFD